VPGEFAGRSVWHGREGFAEFVQTWTEDFEGWSIRAERPIDAGGDRVVALTLQSATGRHSGVPVEMNLGQIYELKGGRMIRVRNYFSHAEALEAAGMKGVRDPASISLPKRHLQSPKTEREPPETDH
jgi:ketosteroid isomerase-like protein